MKKLARASVCAAACLLALGPVAAAVRFDVGVLWNPNPDNDTEVFLHVSNMAYPAPREQVVAVFQQIPDPDDEFPVLAFIAHHARVDVTTVWAYKKTGHTWANVMFHFGLRPSVLFVSLPRPPGPPYGRAYGHWKKHGNKVRPEHLTDDDVRYWVRLHAVAHYASVPPARVWEWRESGKKFETIAANHYREKKGKGPKDSGGPGKGKGKAKGH